MHLRYDEVASHPRKTLYECAAWLDLSKSVNGSKRVIREYTSHAFSGNETRWEGTKVQLDEKWKHHLSENEKQIVWVVAG